MVWWTRSCCRAGLSGGEERDEESRVWIQEAVARNLAMESSEVSCGGDAVDWALKERIEVVRKRMSSRIRAVSIAIPISVAESVNRDLEARRGLERFRG